LGAGVVVQVLGQLLQDFLTGQTLHRATLTGPEDAGFSVESPTAVHPHRMGITFASGSNQPFDAGGRERLPRKMRSGAAREDALTGAGLTRARGGELVTRAGIEPATP